MRNRHRQPVEVDAQFPRGLVAPFRVLIQAFKNCHLQPRRDLGIHGAWGLWWLVQNGVD